MNPREELVDLARTAGMSKARAERFTEEVLAAHAHELAEEQRAFVKEEGVPTGDDPYMVGVGDVIDLIDPHSRSGGVLSPASVQLPPGAEDRYPSEVIARMNQGPARPDEEPTP
ncbi:hypothetical protein [Streptomyces sp. NPDC057336]|uniref:hypothetical protein n=1 Tax=Streptomyces sp. NPDC057336 TaxID=3346102 RepID=UPI00362F5D04